MGQITDNKQMNRTWHSEGCDYCKYKMLWGQIREWYLRLDRWGGNQGSFQEEVTSKLGPEEFRRYPSKEGSGGISPWKENNNVQQWPMSYAIASSIRFPSYQPPPRSESFLNSQLPPCVAFLNLPLQHLALPRAPSVQTFTLALAKLDCNCLPHWAMSFLFN